ncbi:MAG: PorT family protein [Chitinophagaceae bacterium]|nr:MAG: PorT family protein [Chitinophagaceae bacterium]
MAFTHIWNKRDLRCKKVILAAVLLFCFILPATGQKTVLRENYTKYDQKKIRFGFFLALNKARYKVQHSRDFTDQVSGQSSSGQPVPGDDRKIAVQAFPSYNFSLGFIGNLKLHDNIDFRFLPGVGFYRRGVEFVGSDILKKPIKGGREEKVVESAMVELPFLFKFKSNRRKNVRMYFIGGFKQSIDVTNDKDEQTDPKEIFRGASSDFSIEYGFGADLYYPFFKFGPEIRFSHGVNNMLVPDQSAYARAINRMTTHTVTLLLQFE